MKTGQVIRHIRREQGLQANDLAKLIGTAQTEVSQVETGKRDLRLSTFVKYAFGLGMRPSELMKVIEETP